jgi:hypothetical protein
MEFRLELWGEHALAFERAANVAEMKTHLGGVETGAIGTSASAPSSRRDGAACS